MRRAVLDFLLIAAAVDYRGLFLADPHGLSVAQHARIGVLELDADVLADDFRADHDRDVLKHRLAPVAESRRLDGRDLQDAAQFIDDQSRQSFALYVLGDNEKGLAGLHHFFEYGKQILHVRYLAFDDEDVGVLEGGFHAVGIGYHVGADIALVELEAVDLIELGAHGLAVLDGDDPILAHHTHGLGDRLAYGDVVRGNGGNLRLHLLFLDLDGLLFEAVDNRIDRLLDAAAQEEPVGAGRHVFDALADHGAGKHSGRGGAVSGHIVGLRGHFFQKLGANVLERIFKFYLLRDGDAVVGYGRRAELLLEYHIAPLRPKRNPDGISHFIYSAFHRTAGVLFEKQYLCHLKSPPYDDY